MSQTPGVHRLQRRNRRHSLLARVCAVPANDSRTEHSPGKRCLREWFVVHINIEQLFSHAALNSVQPACLPSPPCTAPHARCRRTRFALQVGITIPRQWSISSRLEEFDASPSTVCLPTLPSASSWLSVPCPIPSRAIIRCLIGRYEHYVTSMANQVKASVSQY